MLIHASRGFVFLAQPKTGTTAIETAFRLHAQISVQKLPFKHANYGGFLRWFEPYLDAAGFPRSSYQVVTVVRDPVDWLFSWYRYRSRPELRDAAGKASRNYTGELSFDQFVANYLAFYVEGKKGPTTANVRVGRPSRFVAPLEGHPPVDRVFPYENLDLLVDFLNQRLGRQVQLKPLNVSPPASFELQPDNEAALRDFFAPDIALHQQALTDSR